MSGIGMDGLPAWLSFVLVHLELGTIIWFVEDKCFAVGTAGLLFLWFLGLICSRSRSREWVPVLPRGSVLLVMLCCLLFSATCQYCIHLFHQCIHVGLVHCCHCRDLVVVLFVQHCEQHGLQFSFFLGCCFFLGKKRCLFESQMFCHRCGVLLAFQPLLSEVCLERCPCLLRCGFVSPCDHLVLCEHLALPHLCSCRHCFLGLARCNATITE